MIRRENKIVKECVWIDQITLCPCYIFKKSCIEHLLFYYRELSTKENEHIKDKIADFEAFKKELGMNKMICNRIQTSISLCRENLESVIENNENLCSSETNSYY